MKDITIHFLGCDTESHIEVPFADGGIKAGFPSPAQDYLTDSIDLNRYMIQSEETTFLARVDGESMKDAGISDGDIVVIDKARTARSGDIVAAYVDGEFTLKRFIIDTSGTFGWLMPANPRFQAIRVTADDDFRVWGVVVGLVRKF